MICATALSFETLRHWYRTNKDVEAHLPELTTYIGHGHVSDTYWYISATPELLQLATERLEQQTRRAFVMKTEPSFCGVTSSLLYRAAQSDNEMPVPTPSPVIGILSACCLGFAQKALKKAPSALALADLDAPFIGRFLDHVEKDRGNKPQTRNIRLAAIHSFFHYVALQEPSLGALAQRVLAIPSKRHKTKPVDFLTRDEIDALVAAPTRAPGRAGGTALCCWWRCKPVCGLLN